MIMRSSLRVPENIFQYEVKERHERHTFLSNSLLSNFVSRRVLVSQHPTIKFIFKHPSRKSRSFNIEKLAIDLARLNKRRTSVRYTHASRQLLSQAQICLRNLWENNPFNAMESLFDLCVSDINDMLPHMKNRLMSGNAQVWVVEKILMFLRDTRESERGVVVGQLVRFDMISTICDVMQTSDEDFIKVVLECFEILSAHKEFYENQAAIIAIQTMLRLSYCVNKSLKDSALFERLIQSVSGVLVRSLKLDVSFDTDCILQQIVLFVKNLNVEDLQKNKLKFAAVTMLNVVLQKQAVFDNSTDEEIIDVCHNVLKSMTKIVKCSDDDNAILFAADSLCSTCASSSRFCFMQDSREKNQIELKIREKKDDLEICVYDTMMDILIPYIKDADLSRLDLIEFYKNLISCLNHLYQLNNCNKDNLSNHLTANGYLKRFLYLTVQFSENLRRSTCILLSWILGILGKTAFSIERAKFANILHLGLLQLPKDSTKWDDAIAHKKDGTALIILLYYHFLGTQENDVISLESLIARIMLLPKSVPISVTILKPLWLLFAVTSLSHPRPNLVYRYENAVNQMTSILQHSEISEFYTHHIDLVRYCLKCPSISQDLLNRVLNLWLIESDGDIRPLSFSCDKVVHHLLFVIRVGYPKPIVNVAVKGLHHLMQMVKDNTQLVDEVAAIVWRLLPNILSSYSSDYVAHIETVLELANTIRPSTIPIAFIISSADNIVNIILKKNTDTKFMTLILTQAYILLDTAMSCKTFEVLQTYVDNLWLLKQLYKYGFSKERSQLSTASIKLLAFIIYCQKKSSVKCKKPLTVQIKNLLQLLTYARKSPSCIANGMQFICKLLTLNDDGLAIVLQDITIDIDNKYLINLYEVYHTIHAQTHPISQDVVYQSLVALLHFCNTKATTLMPYLCSILSTCDLIFNINTQHLSCHFVEFVVTWLHYRKANCHDIPKGYIYKTPFDEVLDKLKEYLVLLDDKGMKDAYLNLQRALSQFK
ncbi:uncharacterized protein LOC112455767 [Temnothorax curvispinosus]|uniref:Uncharacterized protein LOC112455767 n=1 Tax=Temnothorax curvispinosus TaxID=300111 RepID=A0A6J1PWI3_9HYME|nr:uncharacterized protein LOC112455767 [Temnothorax curvispinosus]